MVYPLSKVPVRDVFPMLSEIPDSPETLYIRGNLPPPDNRLLAVVGSRNYTDYGKQVVDYLIGGLRGYPITIVSGLAIGIDGFAHEATINAGLHALAVPGSGLDDSVLYPRSNYGLAQNILKAGGGLLSEFEPDFHATQWSFPKRNRIMAGLSHAVLLIEAGERSGTLITARMAVDYNRELLVVPGNIFSENSKGTHQFLKLGATPVTTPTDILEVLNINNTQPSASENISPSEEERTVLIALSEPHDQDTLVRLLKQPAEETLMLLVRMEMRGLIKEENGVFFRLQTIAIY